MQSNKALLSTAIAYANAGPHIGHAFEFVMTDTIARFLRTQGVDLFFVTGMDEHGQKIEGKAREAGIATQAFVDGNATLFKMLDEELSVAYDFFVRTSDKEKHHIGAMYLWNKLLEAGALQKKEYSALYCVGCEEFKTEKDLNEQGECPAHLKKPEEVKEENWFFTLSQYTEMIKAKIHSGELEIIPDTRRNEVLALLDRGLEDVSFSRPKEKVSWGIPVPNDPSQVMYVWCDALSNYITALGYGTPSFASDYALHMTHVVGKDIVRFHAAIWPGMLLASGLPLPKRILVHGFITSGGQKMSKSLGNVISPYDILDLFTPVCDEYAGEALRFVLLHEIPSFDDGDITVESLKSVYTAHLVNGIGNLTNRVIKMAQNADVTLSEEEKVSTKLSFLLNQFDVKKALEYVVARSIALDKRIQDEAPFKVIKVDEEKGKVMIHQLLLELLQIATDLSIFMPKTSAKIIECIRDNKMPEKPLFGRLV